MRLIAIIFAAFAVLPACADPVPPPGTAPLPDGHDYATEMVDGISAYADNLTTTRSAERGLLWHRDTSTPEAYAQSIAPNRADLCAMLGIVERRVAPEPELLGDLAQGSIVGQGPGYTIQPVRWQVLEGLSAEGLLLQPKGATPETGAIIALPDADITPEQLCGLAPGVPESAQYARRLAEQGLRVLVPMLIDRADTYSGCEGVRFTNQPHREFLYRSAFDLGRHPIGYEVQKVQAAIDWLAPDDAGVGVIGYGEGGLLAFYAAAVDTRIRAAAVSGYFGPREQLWQEPIYRNVFGLLREFGDAEITSLIAPRALLVEGAKAPAITGPPAPTPERSGAAPGAIPSPSQREVEAELTRARQLVAGLTPPPRMEAFAAPDGLPGQDATLSVFLDALGMRFNPHPLPAPTPGPATLDTQARLKRQFDEMNEHIQGQMRESSYTRAKSWEKADAGSVETWEKSAAEYRDYFYNEIIGKLPEPDQPLNPRTRLIYDTPAYTGYEVQLDLYTGVFAYGILLVPKGIAPGERRPVVVCQHGLEGRPNLTTEDTPGDPYYHHFAKQLAERGYITFSPQNPYIGGDRFRVLQRKLNPLKLTLFSVITRQHEGILNWLATLPQVDPARIGFYGLSYGGKTAMRAPALLPQYAFSICSGDFNEWIWKNASTRSPYSYVFTNEYEIFEWNLASTFNYAEMSWLIAPRPFMVERGHQDGVAPDDWVAYEYARTRARYDQLHLGDRTDLEVFDGPHTIHGVGTFAFIDRQFNGPPNN